MPPTTRRNQRADKRYSPISETSSFGRARRGDLRLRCVPVHVSRSQSGPGHYRRVVAIAAVGVTLVVDGRSRTPARVALEARLRLLLGSPSRVSWGRIANSGGEDVGLVRRERSASRGRRRRQRACCLSRVQGRTRRYKARGPWHCGLQAQPRFRHHGRTIGRVIRRSMTAAATRRKCQE